MFFRSEGFNPGAVVFSLVGVYSFTKKAQKSISIAIQPSEYPIALSKFARHFRWSRISADKRFLSCLIRCRYYGIETVPPALTPDRGLLLDVLHLQSYNLFLGNASFLQIFVVAMHGSFI